MAYVYNQDKEDQKQKFQQDQGAGTPNPTPTSGGGQGDITSGGPAAGGPAQNGAAPIQNKPTSSGRFTNIQNYLKANTGAGIGNKLEENLQNKTNQVVGKVGQEQTNFNNQTTQSFSPFAGGQEFVKQSIQDAPQVINDQDKFNRFETIRGGEYKGPNDLQNYGTVKQDVQNVRELAGLGNTEAGRFALLKSSFGGNQQYNKGAQTLDNLLLQNQGANLQNLKRISNQGLQSLEQARSDAQGLYGNKVNEAKTLAADTTNQLTGASKETQTQINQRLAEATAYEAQQKQARQDISDLLSGKGLSQILAGTDVARAAEASGDKVADMNKALRIAAQAGILKNKDDAGAISSLYTRLNTPVNKIIEQITQRGDGDLLGYNKGLRSSYNDTIQQQSKLDFGQMLMDSLRTQDATNLTAEGTASAEQKARSNALAKLAGQLGIYNPDAAGYKSSGSAFDLSSLQGRIDKELADLGGVEHLPEIYQDVSMAEKLRGTFAPTGKEIGNQLSQDFDILGNSFDGKGDAKDTAIALARILASPYRAGIGFLGQGAMQSVNNIKEAINGDGNVIEKGVNLGVNGALEAPNLINNWVGDFLQSAPLLKDIGGTELGGALQSVNNSIAQAARDAVSWINPFCYVAGTPIKLEDGSYKAVEKLKIGDKLSLGGKVTGTGEVVAKGLYEYKGTQVSGSHAVYENGKFIRVQDSPLAKKLPSKTTKVYPIMNENHLMVTKTHISSDFAELDEGPSLDMEERLNKLNNDKALMRFLKLKNGIMFNGPSKVRR